MIIGTRAITRINYGIRVAEVVLNMSCNESKFLFHQTLDLGS